ncbi:MAG: hypothetical protein ABI584_02280 [Acidobacteriota bacterium]
MNRFTRPLVLVFLVCLALFAVGTVIDSARAWGGLLTASLFGVTLALGGSVFIAINGVSGARWWEPVKPPASAISATLPVPAATLVATLFLGLGALYPWVHRAHEDPTIAAKVAWLNPPLFLARALIVLLLWLGLGAVLRARLAAANDPASRSRFARISAVFLVLLGPTISVAFWDWAMSLEPKWFSTMFAVYWFSGIYLGGIAAVALLALRREGHGELPVRLTDAVRHDLGKLLFAFSMFWAYIWFSQYLLIWYSNLPEETPYFALRLSGGWSTLFWLNPILNFAVPFVVLMSERAKKNRAVLAQVSIVVLLGRWVDAYLQVGPAVGPLPAFPIYAVASSIALLLAMGLTIGSFGRGVRPMTLEPLSRRTDF